MHKITFECETITPMFMYGANQNEPEIRAPSIKGQIRWCWRAACAFTDSKQLLRNENNLFGSTDQKSNIIISLHDVSRNVNTVGNSLGKAGTGKGYLYYSQLMQFNKAKKAGITKGYFDPGTKFSVTFASDIEEDLEQAIAAFWLLIYLNGLGSRSRRTAGNLNIIRTIGNVRNLSFKPNCNNLDEFKSFILNNLNYIRNIILSKKGNDYSVLENGEVKIVTEAFSNWGDAVENIGKKFQSFRNRKDPDYSTLKNFLRIGQLHPNNDIERLEFGLPFSGQYRSMHGKGYAVKSINADLKRRSSPLILKVWKIGKSYFTGCVKLGGIFLPTNRFIVDEKRGKNRAQFNHSSTGIIDDFMKNHLGQTVGIKL